MNVTSFLKHWKIKENPFVAEEATQDRIFERLQQSTEHPDFNKILGDPARPATSVLFGEKGTGKTAIRLQIEAATRNHNASTTDDRVFVIEYDDLNPILDSFARRFPGQKPEALLERIRLVDHIDGILSVGMTQLVDEMVDPRHDSDLAQNPHKRLSRSERRQLLHLQFLYDRSPGLVERFGKMESKLRSRHFPLAQLEAWLSLALLLATGGFGAYLAFFQGEEGVGLPMRILLGVLVVLTVVTGFRVLKRLFGGWKLARTLSRQIRILDRSDESWRTLIGAAAVQNPVLPLPIDDLDDTRYRLLDAFRDVIRPLGYPSVLVLIDRLDEPTLIQGEAGRMRPVVWPLFNNKFLQKEGFAFKMMLPIELRHELHRQSREFFQEARLDKQNLIDRLVWSGTTLYDLCSARLKACMDDDAQPISLLELFEEGVSRQEVVDALDQMRQPRDAFKLLYQLLVQHCSTVTEEEGVWKIPKLTLDQVRRSQVDRLEALQRGVGPA